MTLISLFCDRCGGDSHERDHAYKCRPMETAMTSRHTVEGVSEQRLDELIIWLDRKWARHKEEEDLEGANALRQFKAARQQLAELREDSDGLVREVHRHHEICESLKQQLAEMRGALEDALTNTPKHYRESESGRKALAALAPTSQPSRGKCETQDVSKLLADLDESVAYFEKEALYETENMGAGGSQIALGRWRRFIAAIWEARCFVAKHGPNWRSLKADCAQPERQGADIRRYERTAYCLMEMMKAYERRVRSACNTPEELAAEPWRCSEYIAAEDALKCGWPAHTAERPSPPPTDDECRYKPKMAPTDDIVAGLRKVLAMPAHSAYVHVAFEACEKAIAALVEKGAK